MERRVRTIWRVRQRYRRTAELLSLAGAVAGALVAVSSTGAVLDGAAWLDRHVLVTAALAAAATGLAIRLLVRGVWRVHRRLRAEQWA
ncbi:hypothetical protein [Benzoatithermus flavus]|uniref:Uncharacterized protein n=1 Tax=Benzoatithermus flavus TaxID=3108223 RepID=A0ABU8XU36_9PROT